MFGTGISTYGVRIIGEILKSIFQSLHVTVGNHLIQGRSIYGIQQQNDKIGILRHFKHIFRRGGQHILVETIPGGQRQCK